MRQGALLSQPEQVAPDVWLLPQFTSGAELWADLQAVSAQAPFRHMMTHTGYPVAAAMTNCGELGWTSDANGYAYRPRDPESGKPWPLIPDAWYTLAREAAAVAGYTDYQPDVCLVNRYTVGTGMGRHADNSEQDFAQPIVSVSLGLPTRFAWWGDEPSGAGRNLLLQDGDVLVWGKSARLGYHAVRPVPAGRHPVCGECRFNLTFRKAG